MSADRFIVCSQNHDQVGNRMLGERMRHLLFLEELKLAAGAVLLSPFVPMLFMDKSTATSPFLYLLTTKTPTSSKRSAKAVEMSSQHFRGKDHYLTLKTRKPLGDPGSIMGCAPRRSIGPSMTSIARRYEYVIDRCAEQSEQASLQSRWHRRSEDNRAAALAGRTAHSHSYEFNSVQVELKLDVSAGDWTRVFDSSAKEWLGPEVSPAARSTLKVCCCL